MVKKKKIENAFHDNGKDKWSTEMEIQGGFSPKKRIGVDDKGKSEGNASFSSGGLQYYPLLLMDTSRKCAIKFTGIHLLNLGGYSLNTHTHEQYAIEY